MGFGTGIANFIVGKRTYFKPGGRWNGKGNAVPNCCQNCGRHLNNHKVKKFDEVSQSQPICPK